MTGKITTGIAVVRRVQHNVYSNIVEHEHRNIHFFTAEYMGNIKGEPLYQEILDAVTLMEGAAGDDELMWRRSSDTGVRDLPIEEQREWVVEQMSKDIDWIIDGDIEKDLRKRQDSVLMDLLLGRKRFLAIQMVDKVVERDG